ncbi:MAG: hypothetical protein ABEI86_04810 [Halobacteriaceae archaeon]
MDNNSWGENIQQQMFQFWEKHLGAEHKMGFEVFTSPIPKDPSIVFMGINPGSNFEGYHPRMDPFLEDGDFSLPDSHDYAVGGEDYEVANFLRDHIFSSREDRLTDSVETNRYYLRTNDETEHSDLQERLGEAWEDYVDFCFDTDQELIERTDPDVIIAFSIETWKTLHDDDRYTTKYHDDYNRPSGNARLIIEAELDGIPVIVLHHPSYLGSEDMEKAEKIAQPMLEAYL